MWRSCGKPCQRRPHCGSMVHHGVTKGELVATISLGLPRFRRALEVPAIFGTDEVDPRAAGLCDRDVALIWRAAEALYRSGAHPAISLCLRRNGHVVMNRALGHARGGGPAESSEAKRQRMTPDVPVCLFSASKAVTAVLVHKLAEEGGISLDRPVADYLPAFGRNGKAKVTISDVLTHRGGFAGIRAPRRQRNAALLAEPERILEYICDAPLKGYGRPGYHALTGGYVLGAIIERVTGAGLREYLDTRLRQPLAMRYFTYGLPAADRDCAARNYVAGMRVRFPISAHLRRILMVSLEEAVAVSNDPVFMDAVIPAGNLYATAEELSRFFQLLLDGGEYQGRRVLAPETVARLVRPRGGTAIDRIIGLPMRYSEGMMTGTPGFSLYGAHSADAWGHLGFVNVLGWAHPSRNVSAALLTTGKAVLGRHLLPLASLLSRISSRCAVAAG